jgi:hypothetical protein
MNKTQKGFAHLESLLILVILAIIVFTGYFVWHSRSQANKALNDAASLNQGSLGTSKKKSNNTPTVSGTKKKTNPAPLINYSTTGSTVGVAVTSEGDVDKLTGASDDFKDFIKDKIKKNGHNPSPCGNAYGLTVKEILNNSFAVGGEGQCGGTEKLWAKVASQWQEVGATQDSGFACSILKQYKVPSAIAGKVCLSDKGEEPYDQD